MRKGKPAKPRNRKRLVLFAAEGRNRTESLYMRDLARDCASVTLHRSRDASTDPVGMVNGLVEAMGYYGFSAEHGDLAFCLVDFDLSHDKERQVRDALRIAEAHGIRLIISNPCFELWYICHFTANPRHYNSSDALVKDMGRYIPSYGKSMEGIYGLLKGQLPDAIRNAESLERRAIEHGYGRYTASFAPATDVHHILASMRECISSGRP